MILSLWLSPLQILTSCFWGSQAEEALQKYLKSKESVSNAVLQTDQALTAKEKETKGEKKTEAMQERQEMSKFEIHVFWPSWDHSTRGRQA